MFQLKNRTPFATEMTVLPNEQGIDTLYLMVKASFIIGEKWQLTDEQPQFLYKDEYWAEPENSSIKYASDFHLGKPASDIIVIGNALSPDQQAVKQLDVTVNVGEVKKTVRVFGDRFWRNGKITAAEPFQIMPLTYERAFGGEYFVDDEIELIEEKNPVGTGFAGKSSQLEMNDVALPNLEDPDNLIRLHSDTPEPACFAIISPGWQNRVNYAGTYDEAWQTGRAPYLPLDYDRRFFNLAHNDLIYTDYLQGGEAVYISNMHSSGDLQFNLPMINPIAEIEIRTKKLHIPFDMETLQIEPNQLKLTMIWRAAIPCDKAIMKINDINIVLPREV